jgi:hypothetical protein
MVNISKLIVTCRTTEASAALDGIIQVYQQSDWTSDAHLTGIFNRLAPGAQRLTVEINRIKTESALQLNDEIRDEKFRAVYYLVTGYTYHPSRSISDAAKKVSAVVEHYGLKVIVENYGAESSLIKSMQSDLSTVEMQTAIGMLSGVSELLSALNDAQSAFDAAYVVYEQAKAVEGTSETAYEIKNELVKIINNELVGYLHTMEQVDSAKYGLLAATAAQIIIDTNTLIKRRRNNGGEKGGTENPDEPEPPQGS